MTNADYMRTIKMRYEIEEDTPLYKYKLDAKEHTFKLSDIDMHDLITLNKFKELTRDTKNKDEFMAAVEEYVTWNLMRSPKRSDRYMRTKNLSA